MATQPQMRGRGGAAYCGEEIMSWIGVDFSDHIFREMSEEHNKLVGNISTKKAKSTTMAIQFLSLFFFIINVIACSIFDSLRDQSTVIGAESSGVGYTDCVQISQVNKNSAILDSSWYASNSVLNTAYQALGPSCTQNIATSGSGDGTVTYDGAFYSTHADCMTAMDSITFEVTVDTTTSSGNKYIYVTLANTPSFVSFAPSVYLFHYMQTSNGGSGQQCNWNQMDINSLMDTTGATAAVKAGLCNNWVSNPPYKCTVYSTKNYMEIVSQSFALTTAFTATLFAIAVSFFGKDKSACIGDAAGDEAESEFEGKGESNHIVVALDDDEEGLEMQAKEI